MLFTSRTRQLGAMAPHTSASKDSKQSIFSKSKQKSFPLTPSELKLREAINIKFERSKIKYFKYNKRTNAFEKEKNRAEEHSPSSIEMSEYSNLINQKYVNIHEYHNKANGKPQIKQYLIKHRRSQNKKTLNTEENSFTKHKLFIQVDTRIEKELIRDRDFEKNQSVFEGSFKDRKTLSGGKKQIEWGKLGFVYHSNVPHSEQKRATSQQDQPKSRLFYLRKQNKSPQTKLY